MGQHEPPAGDLDVDAIVEVLDDVPVTCAVLYGSHARGDATAASDVDLAIAFEDALASTERTRTRLAVIERVSAALGRDDVDVVPLSRASPGLLEEILRDGVLVYGSAECLERYREELSERDEATHRDRIEAFDDLLSDLEGIV